MSRQVVIKIEEGDFESGFIDNYLSLKGERIDTSSEKIYFFPLERGGFKA